MDGDRGRSKSMPPIGRRPFNATEAHYQDGDSNSAHSTAPRIPRSRSFDGLGRSDTTTYHNVNDIERLFHKQREVDNVKRLLSQYKKADATNAWLTSSPSGPGPRETIHIDSKDQEGNVKKCEDWETIYAAWVTEKDGTQKLKFAENEKDFKDLRKPYKLINDLEYAKQKLEQLIKDKEAASKVGEVITEKLLAQVKKAFITEELPDQVKDAELPDQVKDAFTKRMISEEMWDKQENVDQTGSENPKGGIKFHWRVPKYVFVREDGNGGKTYCFSNSIYGAAQELGLDFRSLNREALKKIGGECKVHSEYSIDINTGIFSKHIVGRTPIPTISVKRVALDAEALQFLKESQQQGQMEIRNVGTVSLFEDQNTGTWHITNDEEFSSSFSSIGMDLQPRKQVHIGDTRQYISQAQGGSEKKGWFSLFNFDV